MHSPVVDIALNVHDTVVDCCVAVISTELPTPTPLTETVGVDMFVMLSESEVPESEVDKRSGACDAGSDTALTPARVSPVIACTMLGADHIVSSAAAVPKRTNRLRLVQAHAR